MSRSRHGETWSPRVWRAQGVQASCAWVFHARLVGNTRRIAGADIKDKQPLLDARKSIEKDMERFKACEKEAKVKGYAAGGADKDPKQRAKDEARDWINTVVDALTEKARVASTHVMGL